LGDVFLTVWSLVLLVVAASMDWYVSLANIFKGNSFYATYPFHSMQKIQQKYYYFEPFCVGRNETFIIPKPMFKEAEAPI
jgi:hypothetical protein